MLTIVPNGMYKMTVVAQLIPEDHERKLQEDANQRLAALVKEHIADGVQLEQVERFGSVTGKLWGSPATSPPT